MQSSAMALSRGRVAAPGPRSRAGQTSRRVVIALRASCSSSSAGPCLGGASASLPTSLPAVAPTASAPLLAAAAAVAAGGGGCGNSDDSSATTMMGSRCAVIPSALALEAVEAIPSAAVVVEPTTTTATSAATATAIAAVAALEAAVAAAAAAPAAVLDAAAPSSPAPPSSSPSPSWEALAALLGAPGRAYSAALESHPLLTKALTR